MKRLTSVAACVLLAVLTASCGTSTDEASDGSDTSTTETDDSAGGKFEQTWPKDYGRTTCREWNNEMSQNENFVAAADILVGSQGVDSDDAGLPDDELIEQFRDGITNACVEPSMKVNEIGALLYLTERATFKP